MIGTADFWPGDIVYLKGQPERWEILKVEEMTAKIRRVEKDDKGNLVPQDETKVVALKELV